MLRDPGSKYDAFPRLHLANRKWPNKALTKPPRWLSTDLRDGNQALVQPMDGDAKYRYFQALLKFGYKEIEISYPSAGDVEYDFTRRLIENGDIPDDVWVQVMAPCREDLIRTTIDSVRGAKQVILHIHLSTSDCFRDIVFNMTEQEMIDLAIRCTKLIRSLTKDAVDPEMRQTEWVLEFTPENFQDTSVEYAVEICEAIKAAWEPTEQNQIIFNLASTVEVAMPNVFADQVEYFSSHISEREKVCVSLHNHNDRGCAVATSELGQLAGADRVEGCLFGNGERTGNVDLVTLAMNLYTQGVDPGINFGEINQVVDMVEELTKIPVHLRAPYSGRLTFCTFTGTHQDAIRKGYARRAALEDKSGGPVKWVMPYLPMDPSDLGREHEAVIRLNSQSGKGGIGWFMSDVFNVTLPKELEIALTKIVKAYSSRTGQEVTHDIIRRLFEEHFMLSSVAILSRLGDYPMIGGPLTAAHSNKRQKRVNGHSNSHTNGTTSVQQESEYAQRIIDDLLLLPHPGDTAKPLDAVVTITTTSGTKSAVSTEMLKTRIQSAAGCFGYDITLGDDQMTHVDGTGEVSGNTAAAAFVKITTPDTDDVTRGKVAVWGAGIHADPVQASLQAVLSALANVSTNTST